ncbi:MAG: DNA-directed RNA polymerase subunit alpha [bacterium]|nr:DNA-directed RNA polymerase subunit alpha [bacterium]
MIPLSKSTKIISSKGDRGTFEIEALYPGYGYTVGNSLRRVLLSSLEGAAATQAKIKGAPHEFSTLPGMKEDVLSLLLNLKQIRFRLFEQGPVTVTLKVKGIKTITAGDFKPPSQVEIVNKDLVLAHLTDKSAELEIEIQVGKGVGYEVAESRRRGKEEIGTISLDAIYGPVKKVSYRVEQMRVGDRTDFDRLILEIETDGTLNPEAALKEASSILVKQFEIAGEGLKTEEVKPEEKPKVKKKVASSATRRGDGKPAVKKKAAVKKKK